MFGKKRPSPPSAAAAHVNPSLGMQSPSGVHDDASGKFAEIYGGTTVAQHRMFLVASGAVVVALVSVVSQFLTARNNVAIPIVVEVEPGIGVKDKPVRIESVRPSDAVLKAELARWAVKVFTIDKELSPRYFREANAMTKGLGESQFTEFRIEQGVVERMTKDATLQRIPTVTSVDVSQPGVAFIFVTAKEARANTADAGSSQFRLTVKYEFIPQRTEAAIMVNPLGLFITSMNVSEEGKVK